MTMCSVSSLTAQILLRGWPALIKAGRGELRHLITLSSLERFIFGSWQSANIFGQKRPSGVYPAGAKLIY